MSVARDAPTDGAVRLAAAGPGSLRRTPRRDADAAAEQWDEFVNRCPGDNLVQTTAWAKLKESQGFRTQRIVLYEGGAIVAGALLVKRLLGFAGGVGYVARGPLLARPDRALARRVVDELERAARAVRVHHLVIQPAAGGEPVAEALDRRGYAASSVSLAASATLRLDLASDPEQLLARMARSKRQAVRRAARSAAIAARFGGRADIPAFHRLYAATASRQGFKPLALRELERRWDALAPQGYVQLVMAEAGGEPLAGIWLTACGDTVTARLTGWNREGASLAPNECCDWAAMLWARRQGHRYYDFGNCSRTAAERLATGEPLGDDFLRTADGYKKLMGAVPLLCPTGRQFTFNGAARSILRLGGRLLDGNRVAANIVGAIRNG